MSLGIQRDKVYSGGTMIDNTKCLDLEAKLIQEDAGVRSYILLRLAKIINELEVGSKDKALITKTANEILELALRPNQAYKELLNKTLTTFKEDKYSYINNTERQVIKNLMISIPSEFSNPIVDYG